MTEFVAADLGVSVGDSVMLVASRGREKYIISGIYQCANDMGANIGMSREGYDQIGEETANMWCMHYFLQDVSKQSFIVQTLENNYGGDVYLHENSWPGLFGSNVLPVSAVVGCFVLFSWLAAGKLKKIDLAIWINMEK